MGAILKVFQASLGGSIELLALCGAGAVLSRLGHWNRNVSSAMSNGMSPSVNAMSPFTPYWLVFSGVYKIFLPALIIIAMLNTMNDNKGNGSSQEWWIPLFFSVVVSIITMGVGFLLSQILARNKTEFTKRCIFMCIVLGNSNSMPLLIMKSLCDSFQPLQENELCFMKATTYGTLYNTFFIFLGVSDTFWALLICNYFVSEF